MVESLILFTQVIFDNILLFLQCLRHGKVSILAFVVHFKTLLGRLKYVSCNIKPFQVEYFEVVYLDIGDSYGYSKCCELIDLILSF